MAACGLDFGTSNTTLGVAAIGGAPRLVPLEREVTALPSAVFFDFDSATMAVGQAAIDAYVAETEGRFMRALKSVLGTALIDEETTLRGSRIGFRAVIARFLGEVKRRAEAASGAVLDTVVHGRPVRFVDGDAEADARAEQALAEIARGIGFRHVAFQFEPIAAAFEYERQIAGEEIALVADIGGGTSDFSVVRLGPERRKRVERAADILGNEGVRVGGTDFDRDLSLATIMKLLGYRSAMRRRGLAAPNLYFTDLATWSKINFLYSPKVMSEMRDVRRESAHPELIDRLIRAVELRRGHTLAMAVESAKVTLSTAPRVAIPLDWIEPDLSAAVGRQTFETATAALARRIGERAIRCLAQAGLAAERIDAVFLTGGSTLLPHVRDSILRAVPTARVVEGDKFGAVGLGLTVDAQRRYG
ncbi:MAG TPA: Hsp70 family protein [Stellaceae bacterium]|jgi:hypothetical chaperone protein|nr:Hsp70 family protein [Stellaceae bacterium]